MDIDVGSILRWSTVSLYFACLGVMAAFGFHRWYLVGSYLRNRRNAARPRTYFETLPRLTVQLPLYNEMYVARRLIDAVCAMDYPRDRLEIQLLDDSTDETTAIVADIVADRRSQGFDIRHLHRTERDGYKAGALEAGLLVAQGDLIAIFDADFVPPEDFAVNLVHYFTDPRAQRAMEELCERNAAEPQQRVAHPRDRLGRQ